MIGRLVLAAALMTTAGPGANLGGYRASSSSSGIELLYNDGSEVDLTVPMATTSASTGAGHALASQAYPGPVGGNPGATLKQFLGSHLPPSLADALGTLTYPFKAEAYASGPNDASQQPGVTAHAEPDGSHMAASVVLGDTSTTSSSDASADSVTTMATSTVSDLSIAGLVHLGQVTSTARASSDGTTGQAKGSTTITALSIAGMPVSIDPKTLTLGTSKVPISVGGLLNPVIKALGIQLLVGPEVHTIAGAKAFEQAPAVTIDVAPPQNGGNVFALTVGGATAQAQASAGFSSPVAPPVSVSPVALSGGTSAPSFSPSPGSSSAAAPPPSPAEPAPGSSLPPAQAIAGVPAASEKSKPIPVGLLVFGLCVGAAGAFGLAKVRDDVLAKPAGGHCPLGGNDE